MRNLTLLFFDLQLPSLGNGRDPGGTSIATEELRRVATVYVALAFETCRSMANARNLQPGAPVAALKHGVLSCRVGAVAAAD